MLKYLLIFLVFFAVACTTSNKWGSIKSPTQNHPQVYGNYTAGCMDGAVALPAGGEGYEVVNGARHRFFGQPSLVNFLQKYAAENYRQNQHTLYISDMAQPRGGPIIRGHGSHQTGLDADIWYGKNGELPLELVNRESKSVDGMAWARFDWRILKNAAEFNSVERIFVSPYIKKELCRDHKGEAWMAKIRPWWGHSDHFHVRLACPEGDFCQAQGAVSAGDGCDVSLDWWFSAEAKAEAAKPKEKKKVVLPEQCSSVIGG